VLARPFIAILLSILTLGYAISKDIRLDRRVKKIEEDQAKEKEAESVRRSKASAPFFIPTQDLFGHIYERNDDGGTGLWSVLGGNILYNQRQEVSKNLTAGNMVILVVSNSGKNARKIRLSGDITGIVIKQEPEMSGARHRVFFKYPFSPVDRGKTQKIIISFETDDGYDLTHSYETRHGFFELRRIDPP
jgi:hypothetical protein